MGAKISAGDRIRTKAQQPNILAAHALAAIAASRDQKKPEPQKNTAHVIVQLKRPEEVELLRRTYGHGFFLIAISSPQAERMQFFSDRDVTAAEAHRWIEADSEEEGDFGQRTSKTFHLADVFVSSQECESQLPRFLDLAFSSPFVTPTRDERGMFLAFASSFSSGDLSRQVGAALVGAGGDVIALGYNEVPSPGGGRYEGGAGSARDMELGVDSNHRERARIFDRALGALDGKSPEVKDRLEKTGILDITEYGRAVHAEMDALLACSRGGGSAKGATLYSTTFPCHNCARHIIAAGIRRVVFIEPYPKSRAAELHADAIVVDSGSGDGGCGKIPFAPFIGVGPRRYIDLFSLRLGSGVQLEREQDGKKRHWRPDLAGPRLPLLPSSYLERERAAANEYQSTIKKG